MDPSSSPFPYTALAPLDDHAQGHVEHDHGEGTTNPVSEEGSACPGWQCFPRQLVRSRLCDQLCVEQQVRDQARESLIAVGRQAPGAAPISQEAALAAARADPLIAAKLSVFQSRR